MPKQSPSRRDNFTAGVRMHLERRVASICSKPACGRITTGPHTLPGKSVTVGKAAHITAAADGGPRYDPALTPEQRRSAENGIWLCGNCHDIVDADESPFSAEELRRWKREAEARTRDALELGKKRDQMPLVVSLLHRSMEMIPSGSLARSLPLLLRNDGNREVVLDTRELFGPEAPTDLEAIAAQHLSARDQLWKLMSDFPAAEVAYYGIAHVPTAIHMGFLLGTRTSVQYAERDRDGPTWHWIDESDRAFPPLSLRECPAGEPTGPDIALDVSVSYAITAAQITSSVGEMPRISLSVPEPSLDLVRTKAQVESYSKVFREALERIARCHAVQRIHLFAAVPMSIAFALGRQIRPTVHPTVYAYNFRRGSTPPYSWRLLLSEDASAIGADSSTGA